MHHRIDCQIGFAMIGTITKQQNRAAALVEAIVIIDATLCATMIARLGMHTCLVSSKQTCSE